MKADGQAQRFWNHEYETGRKRLHVVSRDQLRRPQFLGHLCSLEDCHKNVGRFTFGRVYGQDDAANLVAHGAGPVFDSNRPFFRHVPLPSLREVIWRREDQQFGLNAHSVGPNVALPCWRRQLRSDRSQGMAPDTRAFQNRSDLNLSWQPCSHFALFVPAREVAKCFVVEDDRIDVRLIRFDWGRSDRLLAGESRCR